MSTRAVTFNVKRVIVSRELILQALTTGHKHPALEIVRGMPEGARIVDADLVGSTGNIELIVEHESFEAIDDYLAAPVLEIELRSLPENPA